MSTSNPKIRIVISRTDNIGDVVLTLPLAGYLKSMIEGVKIYFVAKSYTRPLVQACIFVDEFLDRDEVLSNPYLLAKIQAEVIIFAYPDKALAKLSKRLSIPYRIGTSHRLFHWWYLNKLVHFSRQKSALHESLLNFKLLKPLTLPTVIPLQDIPTYYGLKPNFYDLQTLEHYIQGHKFNLILHPKSKGSAREWGLTKYFALAQQLNTQKFQIFITGIATEGEVMRQEMPELFALPHVIDLTGKLSLYELINFIYLVDGLVACSTGPLHIAAALDKLAIGIYPPIKPMHPQRWAPVGNKSIYLVQDKKCEQCRKSLRCACIEQIDTETVWQIINKYATKQGFKDT